MKYLGLVCTLLCAVVPAWAQQADVTCPTTRQALKAFCEDLGSEDTKWANKIALYERHFENKKLMLVRLPCSNEDLKACKARYRPIGGFYSRSAGRWIDYHLFFGDSRTKRHVLTFLFVQDLRDHLNDDMKVFDMRQESERIKRERFYGPRGLLAQLKQKKMNRFSLYLKCCENSDHWNRVMSRMPRKCKRVCVEEKVEWYNVSDGRHG